MVFFWFRRDLRLHDNCALYHALKSGQEVLPVFIFDSNILEKLPNAHDQRVDLLHQVLGGLKQELENMGSSLLVVNGQPLEVWQQLIASHSPTGLYFNHDYEPYAQSRDEAITHLFALNQKRVFSFKDQVIFEKSEVVKDDGLPYTVFTPYFNKWQKALTSEHYTAYDNALWFRHFKKTKPLPLLSLSQLGFEKTKFTYEPPSLDQLNVANYSALRDYPAKAGTSKMSVNLRFGMVSIRGLVLIAIQNNHHKYLAELVWREFYHG
jgi:deoxyribodipyrimidine photo-lyase